MMTFPTALDPLSLSLEERWMWADIQSHTDASVRKALRDLLPVSPWANVDLFIRHSLSHEFPAIEALWHSPTQFDQDWTFFRAAHLLGVPYERTILARLEIMDTLTRHAGWFLFHKDCCILCERPTTISIEPFSENSGGPTAYRLHQANGPAMEFRDGWPLYAWHGQTSAHP